MLKPLHNNVVLEKKAPESKTKSGIILTSDDQEKPKTAKVVAVGPGKDDKPMSLSEGDIVVYRSYATTDVELDGNEYLIIEESDILAKVEGDDHE
ncbi:MAG: co-chaperone GroES [Bacillota bacterium]